MTVAGRRMGAPPSVAVIGSGFGGVAMAIRLKAAGIHDVTLYEKADRLGGTWRDNTYPGAACDVPSHLYSYSFEPKRDWSQRFATQPEILAYLEHCARKYGVLPHVRFGAEVAEAAFDEARGRWTVVTTGGERATYDFVVAACGQLNRPLYPRIEGLDAFAGAAWHSARWDHGYDLRGKRVAVIGTGASTIQFLPPVAAHAARATVFQRTPPWILPKSDRAYGTLEQALFRIPGYRRAYRAQLYWGSEVRYYAFEDTDSTIARLAQRMAERHLAREIADPALRAKLTPDYPIGCKRVLISNEYYPALRRPNVALETTAIARVEPAGVRTADGRLHEADVLLFGTGFQSTDFLAPMRITGKGGADLNAAWRDGAEAYLGVTVAGFPNFFLLYGPNTNLAHNSIIFMLESQARYVVEAVLLWRRRGLRYLDVRADVQRAFNTRVQDRLDKSVWNAGCSNWYKNAAGKQTNNWPGFTIAYRLQTRRLDPSDYELVARDAPAGSTV